MYALSKVLVIVVFSYCQLAVAAATCQSLTEIDWILGDWLSKSEKNDIKESWRKLSEQTFEGQGVSIDKQGQQSSSEELRLLVMQGEIFYLAKVSHNPLPVAFKAISCNEQQVVFENPHHDFPNRLDYSLQANGNLQVNVSDLVGKGFEIEFQPVKKAD